MAKSGQAPQDAPKIKLREISLMKFKQLSLGLGLLLSLSTTQAFADWSLVNSQSQLNFLSTKKSQVTELHKFNQLSGKVSDLGQVEIQIDLNSVDTQIPIRNQRMQEFLFETTKFATAELTAQLKPALLKSLAPGSAEQISLKAELNLHGHKQNIDVQAIVFKQANNDLKVISTQPILLQASQFDLVNGLNKLQELAGLPSITYTVPVTFSLEFKAD